MPHASTPAAPPACRVPSSRPRTWALAARQHLQSRCACSWTYGRANMTVFHMVGAAAVEAHAVGLSRHKSVAVIAAVRPRAPCGTAGSRTRPRDTCCSAAALLWRHSFLRTATKQWWQESARRAWLWGTTASKSSPHWLMQASACGSSNLDAMDCFQRSENGLVKSLFGCFAALCGK